MPVRISDPIWISKRVQLKNRFVNAPMYRCFGVEDGFVKEQYVESYKAEARGGPGMIIVANTAVTRNGVAFPRLPRIDDDRFIPGLADIAYEISLADVVPAIQLFHGGIICRPDCIGGERPVSASEIPLPFVPGMKTRALEEEEIEEIIADFGRAAARAQAAGYKAVNVHGCHGGLIHQFISHQFNKRDDKWGVDKLLFMKRVVKAIRDHTDPDFPIVWRLSAEEYAGIEGYDFDFTLNEMVPALDEAGIDVFDVSTGGVTNPEALSYLSPILYRKRGSLVKYAEAVKKITKKPVLTVGKLYDLKLIGEILEKGQADLIGLGRVIVADPDFPKKALAGDEADIRKCVTANICLSTSFFQGVSVRCAVNPGYGKEKEYYDIVPATKKKRIMVVGGGIAGMEFARVATLRGHDVTVYEKSDRLGGLAILAASFPKLRCQDIFNIIRYLSYQMEKLKINVIMEKEVTPYQVQRENPEVLIVATGSRPHWPQIDGIQKPIVTIYEDFLAGKMRPGPGKRVVVIGGHEGAETAVSIAMLGGRDVWLIEKSGNIAKGVYLVDPARVQILVQDLIPEHGVRTWTHRKVTEILDNGVVTIDKHGVERVIECDDVIVTCGREPNEFLKEACKGIVPEIHVLGDALGAGPLSQATHTGAFWARQV